MSDPQRSRVVLIGTSEYESPQFKPLPAVAANLTALGSLFLAPDLWGLPAANCTVLLDCEHPGEVLAAVREAAEAAEDTLVVYYAGHGLRSPEDGGLHLALRKTMRDRMFTALRYADLGYEVLRTAADVKRKVVLLDCCFSGAALQGAMGASDEAMRASIDIADQARIDAEGTYVMTASASTVLALAPEGATYTAFTGEIIATLDSGLPGGLDLLSMERIYRHVRRALDAKGMPIPQQRAGNFGGMISLVRNRAAIAADGRTAVPTVSVSAAPHQLSADVPAGYEFALTAPAREVALALDELAAADRAEDFAALLAAISTQADARRIADLLGYLSAAEAGYASALFEAMLRRNPKRLVELVGALDSSERDVLVYLENQAVSLVGVAAAPVAELARLLRIDHFSFSHRLTAACLMMAADGGPHEFVRIVDEFRSAGLQEDLEHVLRTGPDVVDTAETVAFGKALEFAGRGEVAAILFDRNRAGLEELGADTIAAIVRAARKSGHHKEAASVMTSVLSDFRRKDLVAMAMAFSSAGLDEDVDLVLDRVVLRGVAEVGHIARALHAADCLGMEFELYRKAILRKPVAVVDLLGSLPESRRADDGLRLLAEAVKLSPPGLVEVILELDRRDLRSDIDRLSALVLDRRMQIADVAVGLVNHGRTSLARPYRDAALTSDWLSAAKVIRAGFDATDVARLGRKTFLQIAKACQESFVGDIPPIIFAHLTFEGIGDLLAAFRELEWDKGLKIFCAPAMAMSFNEARTAYAELMQAGPHTEARLLVEKLAFFHRPSDIPVLVDVFSGSKTSEAVRIIIETVAMYRSPSEIASIIRLLGTRRRWRKWITEIQAVNK